MEWKAKENNWCVFVSGKEAPSYTWRDFAVRSCAEIAGTAILVFMGCISCVNSMGDGVNHTTICLAFGFAVLVVVQIFGHISGSHVNPAVTVAAVIMGELKHYGLVPVYIISQCIGATLGYGIIYVSLFLYQKCQITYEFFYNFS